MKSLIYLLLIFSISTTIHAQRVGIGNTTPAPSAILEVSSTSQGFIPPRMTRQQRNEIKKPAEGLIIYNTSTKLPNIFNGTEWQNFDGSYDYGIGDFFQGGKIFYIFKPGDIGYVAGEVHGLIAAPFDQGEAPWGCEGTFIGNTYQDIGTGKQNTVIINANCSTPGRAARLCADLVLNGYSDWYLPSINELFSLSYAKKEVGGFSEDYYWSSSEFNDIRAYYASFFEADNGIVPDFKHIHTLVRAIRSF